MHYIFLDTNVFLHFKDFDQIKWMELLGSEGPVAIVVAPTVINELDTHKYNKKPKVSKRARSLLPRIEQHLASNPPIGTFKLIDATAVAGNELYSKHNLDRQNQDDNILASILAFMETIPDGGSVYFASHDSGPRIKAKRLGITLLELPEHFQLPNEPDETELKNRQLQKELDMYRNLVPIVGIAFGDGKSLHECRTDKAPLTRDEYIALKLEKTRKDHPRLQYFPSGTASGIPSLDKVLAMYEKTYGLTESQVERYNRELDEYLGEYELALHHKYSNYLDSFNTLKVDLMLSNTGTTPADDIDIELHFPDGFELCDIDGRPKKVSLPSPPVKPKNRFDIGFRSMDGIKPVGFTVTRSHLSPNVSSPSIKKTNSYDVRFHVKKLKHNQPIQLESLFARFGDILEAKGFEITYRLKIGNMPKVVEGSLFVKFIKHSP